MRILLTNDDGVKSEGLCTLASVLKKAGHTLYIVAPEENNSAVSHKIHMLRPLPLKRVQIAGIEGYSLAGTPADCVLIALCALHYAPELVISGINEGINLGSDVIYSGTVAAALEGAQNGIPAIALSMSLGKSDLKERFLAASEETAQKLFAWKKLAGEFEGVLNVNFPRSRQFERGAVFCPCSKTNYRTSYRETEEGYLMEFNPPEPAEEGGDIFYHKEGYITLTPLSLNMTDERTLRRWNREA